MHLTALNDAFTERLMGSIRREALDHFLLFSEKQVRKIISGRTRGWEESLVEIVKIREDQ